MADEYDAEKISALLLDNYLELHVKSEILSTTVKDLHTYIDQMEEIIGRLEAKAEPKKVEATAESLVSTLLSKLTRKRHFLRRRND